ncbi:MAG: hypothetical protein AB1728_11590 [Bacteroidota bacterium]
MLKHFLTIALCVVVTSAVCVSSAAAQSLPKKTHSHEVPLDSAKKFIKNLEKDAIQMKTKGGLFYREIFDRILAQKGCIGIRYYYAKMDDGNPTLVIVGVDSTGKDMSKGITAEQVTPCPPYCDETTTLLNK